MTLQAKNPAALRLLFGWIAIAALTLSALAAANFLPPHPGFSTVFIPACVALLAQGVAAMMAAKRGAERLGWIILLTPVVLIGLTLLAFFILFAIGTSG